MLKSAALEWPFEGTNKTGADVRHVCECASLAERVDVWLFAREHASAGASISETFLFVRLSD